MNGNNRIKQTDNEQSNAPRLRIVDDLVNAPRFEIINEDNDPLNIYGIPASEMTPMVRQAVTSMHNEIIALKNERVRLASELRHALTLADTDPLTGILNRRAFEREMARALSFARRMNVDCTLLFFDLNGFKKVNDTYGHDVGDSVIRAFARCLRDNLRGSDVLGRLGGDEFVALLVKANYQEATIKSQQIHDIIDTIKVPHKKGDIDVKCTIGVHSINNNEKINEAIKSADKAMYANKLNDKIATL